MFAYDDDLYEAARIAADEEAEFIHYDRHDDYEDGCWRCDERREEDENDA